MSAPPLGAICKTSTPGRCKRSSQGGNPFDWQNACDMAGRRLERGIERLLWMRILAGRQFTHQFHESAPQPLAACSGVEPTHQMCCLFSCARITHRRFFCATLDGIKECGKRFMRRLANVDQAGVNMAQPQREGRKATQETETANGSMKEVAVMLARARDRLTRWQHQVEGDDIVAKAAVTPIILAVNIGRCRPTYSNRHRARHDRWPPAVG